jgi:peptidoglycan hydrolase-like protein with peptidoglycan-binding domain
MKLTKKQMLIGAGIAAAIGVYLIIKSIYDNKNTPIPPTPTPPTPPASPLPIVRGDRDPGAPFMPVGKVVDLQKLINLKGYTPKLVEDGIFGPKTELGVQSILNKKTVDTQADLDKFKS